MKKVLRLSVIGTLLVFLVCPLSFGAEFRLKNGDSVTGELVSYDGTTFRVKSKFGVLSIEASEIAVIGLNTEEGLVDIVLGTPTTDDRDRVKGTIEYVREGEVKIKTDYGYVVVNPLDKATGIFMSEAEAGKVQAGTANQPATGQQVIESKGFSFALQSCNRSGESVSCYLLVTSNGQDRKLGINGDDGSRLFDDSGGEYLATHAQLGRDEGRDDAENTLPANVPTKASLHFENISSQAGMIALLDVQCFIGRDFFNVQYRNVPFSQ